MAGMPGALQLLRGGRYEVGAEDPRFMQEGGPPIPSGRPDYPMGERMPSPLAPAASPSSAQALIPGGRGPMEEEDEEIVGYTMPARDMQQGRALMRSPTTEPMAHEIGARPDQQMNGQPQQGMPDYMTPERKAMYDRAKKAAQNYSKAVASRRQRRKADREYSKLYNEFERERGKIENLEALQKNYPELFRSDDPKTLGMIKQQMSHFESAERAKQRLMQMLKKHGVKVDQKSNLPDSLFGGGDDADDQFDQFVGQGYRDAMLYRGEGY